MNVTLRCIQRLTALPLVSVKKITRIQRNGLQGFRLGDAPWKCFKTTFDEEFNENTPRWKRQEYDVWFRDPVTVLRNMLENPDFAQEWDTAPYVELDSGGNRRRADFMSADFAWRQCVSDPMVYAFICLMTKYTSCRTKYMTKTRNRTMVACSCQSF